MSQTVAERISEIDRILAGPEQVRAGDRWITHNHSELRKERAHLVASQSKTGPFRRVVFKTHG